MFYDALKEICEAKGIKMTNVVKAVGLSSANMGNWKRGRTPKLEIIKRIAAYLDVPVSAFTDEDELSEDDKIKFALFGETKDITDEMFDDVKRYAQFVKEKYKNKDDNNK